MLAVLDDLGLGQIVEDGLIEVLNKIDLFDEASRDALLNQAQRNDEVVALSAVTGEGCDGLLALVAGRLDSTASARTIIGMPMKCVTMLRRSRW